MKSPYLERNIRSYQPHFDFHETRKLWPVPQLFFADSTKLDMNYIWLPRNSSKQPGEAVGPPGKVMNQRWDERYRSIIPLLFTESFLRTWNLFVFYFGSWILQKKVISGPVIVYIYTLDIQIWEYYAYMIDPPKPPASAHLEEEKHRPKPSFIVRSMLFFSGA